MTIRLHPLESKDSFNCTLSPVPGTVVHIDRTGALYLFRNSEAGADNNAKTTNNNSQRLLVSRSTPLALREKGSPQSGSTVESGAFLRTEKGKYLRYLTTARRCEKSTAGNQREAKEAGCGPKHFTTPAPRTHRCSFCYFCC